MDEVLLSTIRLNELETLIQNSVKKALENNPRGTQTQSDPDQLLTVHQAAEFLSLAVPTIYSMVSKGELPVMKRSKRLYFSRLELMDYLKAGRKKTLAETEAEAPLYLNKGDIVRILNVKRNEDEDKQW